MRLTQYATWALLTYCSVVLALPVAQPQGVEEVSKLKGKAPSLGGGLKSIEKEGSSLMKEFKHMLGGAGGKGKGKGKSRGKGKGHKIA